MPKPLPVIRRVRIEPRKMGAAFQEMLDFIGGGKTIKRMEIVAESAELERTKAKKLHRRVVLREHRLVVEFAPVAASIDKRRRHA